MLVARYLLPVVWADGAMIGVIGGVAGALAIVVWWLGFSRAPWPERIGGTRAPGDWLRRDDTSDRPVDCHRHDGDDVPHLRDTHVEHRSHQPGRPPSRALSSTARIVLMVAAVVLACGVWTLLRTDGITGGGMGRAHLALEQNCGGKSFSRNRRENCPSSPR